MTEFEILNLILANASESGFDWGFVTEHSVNLLILLGVISLFCEKASNELPFGKARQHKPGDR